MELKNISKVYGSGAGQVFALKDISLKVPERAFMTITGPSGSGKSTLLNILGLLMPPTAGAVYFGGKKAEFKDFDQGADFRSLHLGFIFQSFNLIPVLSARENVLIPLVIRKDLSDNEKNKRTDALLDALGISEHAHKKPDELSGGQKQRVAVARSLVGNPHLVLADEPTANLDSENSEKLLQLMLERNKKMGTAFLFSTHDPRVVKYAKQKVHIADGEIQKR
jgi:putative ABC transport system ATP-binding protein